MTLDSHLPGLVVVVGGGGVGKTSLAAALGLRSAEEGTDTLVMTFDPSKRLKDALGVDPRAGDEEVTVEARASGRLAASLLDAGATFDRLVKRYAPDRSARDRILSNRYYRDLSGALSGILEYMAVERLFEVAGDDRYQRIVLDTPPTREALDFLEAPERIVSFLESGALKIALKPWFDDQGRLRPTSRFGRLGRRLEGYLDELVGLELLHDMTDFFQAFAPLFEGFRERAVEVGELLRDRRTMFVLVTGPGEDEIPDLLFFARRLAERGHRLGPIVVNRVHPHQGAGESGAVDPEDGAALLRWLGERDHRGLAALRSLLSDDQPLVALPLMAEPPTELAGLSELAERWVQALERS